MSSDGFSASASSATGGADASSAPVALPTPARRDFFMLLDRAALGAEVPPNACQVGPDFTPHYSATRPGRGAPFA
jgi:hypothetical protein